ncbi:MAG: metallophosphoesterase family protein [Tumebacillaceae bacterium]
MKRIRMLRCAVVCLLFCSYFLPTPAYAKANETGADKPLFSFAVFSDVHVHAGWSPSHKKSVVKFTNALRDIAPMHPEFLVINGDLTDGRPQDYKQLLSLYKANATFPLYPTMGNHEYYYQYSNSSWNDKREQEEFRRAFHLEQLYYDRFVRGIHLIFLSPEQYMPKQKQIGEAAWLSPEQIKWFEDTLQKSNAPTFVFLHQPLNNTVFSEDHGLSTVQSEQLIDIASRHPQVIWFSGHSHVVPESKTEAMRRNGILFLGTSSVFSPEEVLTKPAPGTQQYENVYLREVPTKSESRFVDVYSDRIVIRTRHHHSHVFGPGTIVEPIRNE